MKLAGALRNLFDVEKIVSHGGRVVAIVVISCIVYFLLRRAIKSAASAAATRIEELAHRQRVTTLLLLVGSVVKYVIIFLAGMMALKELGLDPMPILAGAGVVGLAVGFGAQNLVRDVVSGFFIIMEGQYAVGDLVEINGVFGRVEEVGLRVTKLRDPKGQLCYFPNGSITGANNYTEHYLAHVITVPLPTEAPPDPTSLVRAVLEDFEMEFHVFAAPPTLALEELPGQARLVRAETQTIPGRQAMLEQKLPARLSSALERAGLSLPAGADVSISLRFPPPGSMA